MDSPVICSNKFSLCTVAPTVYSFNFISFHCIHSRSDAGGEQEIMLHVAAWQGPCPQLIYTQTFLPHIRVSLAFLQRCSSNFHSANVSLGDMFGASAFPAFPASKYSCNMAKDHNHSFRDFVRVSTNGSVVDEILGIWVFSIQSDFSHFVRLPSHVRNRVHSYYSIFAGIPFSVHKDADFDRLPISLQGCGGGTQIIWL